MLTYQTPFVPVASVAVSDTSTSLFRTYGFQKVRSRGGRIAILACRTLRVSDSAGSPAARCSAGINAPGCAVSSGTNARAYRGAGRDGRLARPDVDRVEASKLARKRVLAAD